MLSDDQHSTEAVPIAPPSPVGDGAQSQEPTPLPEPEQRDVYAVVTDIEPNWHFDAFTLD